MSLEESINKLTAAVEANTAAIKGGAAPAKGGSSKTTSSDYTAKHSKEEMQAVMQEVKEKCGMEKAKEIRDTVGKVGKITELSDPKVIDAVYDAGKKALAEKEADDV